MDRAPRMRDPVGMAVGVVAIDSASIFDDSIRDRMLVCGQLARGSDRLGALDPKGNESCAMAPGVGAGHQPDHCPQRVLEQHADASPCGPGRGPFGGRGTGQPLAAAKVGGHGSCGRFKGKNPMKTRALGWFS